MEQRVRIHYKVKPHLQRLLGWSTPSRVSKRARVLLLLSAGGRVEEVAERVGCGTATVNRVRRRYQELGWESAVYDAARPGRPKKLSDAEEKQLIAIACTDPPQGHARWTIRLLVAHSGVDASFGVVQQVLKRDGLKPWREKNVVCSVS